MRTPSYTQQVGEAAAEQALQQVIQQALDEAGKKPEDVECIVLGMSGCDREEDVMYWKQVLPRCMYVYMCVCTGLRMCECDREEDVMYWKQVLPCSVYACMLVSMYAYLHVFYSAFRTQPTMNVCCYVHTHMHACMHAFMHACIYIHTRIKSMQIFTYVGMREVDAKSQCCG
jgi:hypothetical protein